MRASRFHSQKYDIVPVAHFNYFDQSNIVLRAKGNTQLAKVQTSTILKTTIWDAVGEIPLRENLGLNGFC